MDRNAGRPCSNLRHGRDSLHADHEKGIQCPTGGKGLPVFTLDFRTQPPAPSGSSGSLSAK